MQQNGRNNEWEDVDDDVQWQSSDSVGGELNNAFSFAFAFEC
jgi:hypothetical protein